METRKNLAMPGRKTAGMSVSGELNRFCFQESNVTQSSGGELRVWAALETGEGRDQNVFDYLIGLHFLYRKWSAHFGQL